mmetsp:Transcript_19764/g.23723  ORF Transcript_19764/g.23723 Transcript_19764/m.23723 type:complete len:273 (+) Transcript_19764:83-901(+)
MCCCNLPPGTQKILRWVLFGLVFLSWIFGIVAVASCKFIEINSSDYGMFSVYSESRERCIPYAKDASFDGAESAARAFGVLMSLTLSFAMAFIVGIMLFIPESMLTKILWMVCRGLLPASAVFSVLMFSIFGNDACTEDSADCSTSGAGIIDSLNVFILIACTVLSCLVQPPTEPVFAISIQLSKNVDKQDKEVVGKSGIDPSKPVAEAVEIEVRDGMPVIKQEDLTNSSPEAKKKSNRPGKDGDSGIDSMRPPARSSGTGNFTAVEGEFEA